MIHLFLWGSFFLFGTCRPQDKPQDSTANLQTPVNLGNRRAGRTCPEPLAAPPQRRRHRRRWRGLREASRWRWHWQRVPRAPADTDKSASTVLRKKKPKLYGGGAGFVWDLDGNYTLRVFIGIFSFSRSARPYGGCGLFARTPLICR